jgi:tetratricopeptide (TPR) repeat protein
VLLNQRIREMECDAGWPAGQVAPKVHFPLVVVILKKDGGLHARRYGDGDVTDLAADRRLASLTAMLKLDPENSSLRSQCVNLAVSLGDYARARAIVHSRLRESPYDASALFDDATVHIAQKQYREAVTPLAALLAGGVVNSGVLMNLGLCHYCLADYAAANEVLRKAYDAGERNGGLIRLLVSTLHHLGRLDEAIDIADANAEAAREDGALAGVFALAYLDAERAIHAARCAKTALRLNPDSVDGLVVDGTLQITQMRVEKAREELRRALELAPHTGRAWLGLGTLALLERDFPKARELLGKATEYMGNHVGTWHTIAWAHLTSGDLDAAAAAFDRSLELNRNFAETHGGIAAVAALRGDREAAEKAIAVAERLDPECLSAKFARAVLAGAAGDPTLARRIVADTAAGLSRRDNSALSRLLGDSTRSH